MVGAERGGVIGADLLARQRVETVKGGVDIGFGETNATVLEFAQYRIDDGSTVGLIEVMADETTCILFRLLAIES